MDAAASPASPPAARVRVSSMALELGDGLMTATRWRDGTVTIAVTRGNHIEEAAANVAAKLEQLARFARGGVREGAAL